MAVTKEPSQVAAAVEIVSEARRAIGEAMQKCDGQSWDSDVLLYELARVLGLALRNEETTPSQFDNVIRFLRQVYGGVYATGLVTVEEAVQFFCEGQVPASSDESAEGESARGTLH